jgi:uncharacterized protein YjbI with pentapeptide repeats
MEQKSAMSPSSPKQAFNSLSENRHLWPIRRAIAIITTFGLAVIAVLVVAGWALLGFSGIKQHPDEPITTYFELLKLAFAFVAGIGGTIALVVAYRRQRLAEIAHEHTEQVAKDNLKDATERRITDLYIKAVEQIGHDKAAVRLGGLHALERLAQDHPSHRQTIVDVICAYLRMPWHPLAADPAEGSVHQEEEVAFAHTEKQVRLTAQRILTRHLRPRSTTNDVQEAFWDGMDIDLSEAQLIDFVLSHCIIRKAVFDGTIFHGHTMLGGTIFKGRTHFTNATFKGFAGFSKTVYLDEVSFSDVKFQATVYFMGAQFKGAAYFNRAYFGGDAIFLGGQYRGGKIRDAVFLGAKFLTEATAKAGDHKRLWPDDWEEEADPENLDTLNLRLVVSLPVQDSMISKSASGGGTPTS